MVLIVGFVVVVVGCSLCAWLDIKRKKTDPVLYFLVGAVTGVLGVVLPEILL